MSTFLLNKFLVVHVHYYYYYYYLYLREKLII
jgi:hypothetical protein